MVTIWILWVKKCPRSRGHGTSGGGLGGTTGVGPPAPVQQHGAGIERAGGEQHERGRLVNHSPRLHVLIPGQPIGWTTSPPGPLLTNASPGVSIVRNAAPVR